MTQTLHERDARVIGSLQKLRFFPLAIVGGKGARLIEEGGRELIDFSGAWGAASLGYGHPAIVEAVSQAVATAAGASILSASNAPAVALAEKLLASFPGNGTHKVWFGHSGSDANEAVFRAVMKATGRNGIVAFSGAYHGCTMGSMAFSGHTVQAGAAKAKGLLQLPYPDPYRPYLDDPSGDAVLDLFRAKLKESAPGSFAAAFVEPILSDGGVIVPPEGFLRKFATLCREHDILVVCDEVKVGLGRSGKLHCFEHEGFVPDILVLGKGLGGGLPLSSVIAPSSILDCASAFAMQTLHGNPVCAAAAMAVLGTIEKEQLADAARQKGQKLNRGLLQLAEKHALIGNVRGRGLVHGVELVNAGSDRIPAKRETMKLIYRAYELGLVLYYVGMDGNVLEITPPLTITEDEIDQAIDILDQAFSDLSNGLIPDEIADGFDAW